MERSIFSPGRFTSSPTRIAFSLLLSSLHLLYYADIYQILVSRENSKKKAILNEKTLLRKCLFQADMRSIIN